MKRVSRIIVGLLGILLLSSLLLTGCGGGENAEGKTYTIKIANYFATDHPQNIALREKFKPIVEKESGGKIKVEIYDNSKLGAEDQFIDGVKNGNVEMAVAGMLLAKDLPKLGITELPGLFRDYDHAYKALNSEAGQELTEGMIEKMGVRRLAWTANGFRVVSSNIPIEKFEDFKGMRLRVPNAPRFIEFAKAIGANPSPTPISEVFTALEQNVVDGQENPYATLRASGFYEVQKYVVDTRHIFSPNLYIINEKFYQSLDPELQEIIQKAAKEAADYEWQLLQEQESKDIEFLKKNGLKVVFPDDTFKKQLLDSLKPVHEWFYKTYPGTEELAKKLMDIK
ncbi:MAG: TRAP transporter substrate-binding protein [Thermoanaerobacteraceae bacterium]|nr:TRAP transporter substrate-binding protein [Thermoanaerobacteraceae bacterium]